MRLVRSIEVERPRVEKVVRDLGEYYFKDLTDNQVNMYTEDLLDLGSETVEAAAKYWRMNEFNKSQFPLPSDIRSSLFWLQGGFDKWLKKKDAV